jgi:hypothetical protein
LQLEPAFRSQVSGDARLRTQMRLIVIMSTVALGLLAGTLYSAQADRWPADLWERLDRDPA